jgi:methyl-accepting chemotaxis protein
MIKRLTQSRINFRLPMLIVFALFFSITTMSYISYVKFVATTKDFASVNASTVAGNAQTNVENWVAELSEEIDALAEDQTTQAALLGFTNIFAAQTGTNLRNVRDAYLDDSPFPVGQRQLLDQSAANTPYDLVHAKFHDQFRTISDRSGYYDLFLITPDGLIAYSVFKEGDFGERLDTGRLLDSGLAKAYRGALAANSTDNTFIDFEPYAPSADQPASFMARQVIGKGGEVLGVVAIQLPIGGLKSVLSGSEHLTEKDEVYIVGADGLARSEPRQADLFGILDPTPDLPQTDYSTAGETGYLYGVEGINGKDVVAFVRSFDVKGKSWSVVVELDYATTFADVANFRQISLIMIAIGVLMSLVIGYLVARSITRPLHAFSNSMSSISEENYDAEICGLNRLDEIGDLSRILQNFRDKLVFARDAAEREAFAREEQARIVGDLGHGLKDLASGNLAIRIKHPFSEEYEGLRSDFNSTVETMNELMRTIVSNAQEIRGRAEEISASSEDLSQRTENQAATLEETAAALDELTASVRAAADGASEVERVVAVARQDAEQSGSVVSEAVEAMSLIRKSSTEISQIIGVIDDIAFQTNLLSLNAGVEAARAGDAGRGFAVVASEVRALAQRSSEAAKQIKSLITSSTEQVETGVGLVGRTGEALGSIVDRVSDIDKLVGDIATGSREQSVGLGEINIGIAQLDQVTQQNAAMVEEATAAATTLKNESIALTQLVARFKLTNDASQPLESSDIVQFRDALAVKPAAPSKVNRTTEPKFEIAANGSQWQDF